MQFSFRKKNTALQRKSIFLAQFKDNSIIVGDKLIQNRITAYLDDPLTAAVGKQKQVTFGEPIRRQESGSRQGTQPALVTD